MLRFLAHRWFLLALTVLFVVGLLGAAQLKLLAEWTWLRQGNLFLVMFITALPLDARSIWQTLKRPVGPLVAVVMTYGLLPLCAWGLSFLLSDPSLAGGLLVASVTPCTLASAAVWTRRAGGNEAIAIVSTIVTNGVCFLVAPLWLAVMLGSFSGAAKTDLTDLIPQLALLVVLPMVVSQLARLNGVVAEFSIRRKRGLSLLAQGGILMMVFIGAIQTGLRMGPLSAALAGAHVVSQLAQIGLMMVLVLGLHTAVFFIGFWLSQWAGLPKADAIGVGFSGSQKTLMVGLEVAMASHLSILPMITFHAGQLFVDTLIADRLRETNEREDHVRHVASDANARRGSGAPDVGHGSLDSAEGGDRRST